MKQQTDRSPVSGALPPPVAVNLNQVPGCQARRAVTGFIAFLRCLGSIHHLREPPPVGEGLFQAVYKIRSEYGTKIAELRRQIQRLREQEREALEKVLTAEQRKHLRELRTGEKSKEPVPEKPTKGR